MTSLVSILTISKLILSIQKTAYSLILTHKKFKNSLQLENKKEKLSWKCNKEDHPVWFALPKIANIETWCICCSRESRKTLKINT